VADLDNDGTREIAFTSFNDSLYVIDAAGNVRPGFPRGSGDDFRTGAVVGDLDNDGTMEILAGNNDANVYAYNHDGSDYLPGGLFVAMPNRVDAGIVLANLDADPELEVLVACFDGKLYAYNHDGTSFLSGTGGVFAAPSTSFISATPIVVDVDGDGDFEIFLGHRDGNFYGYHHDGSTVVGMPIPTGNQIFSTPAAGDLDGDGDVDVAFASYDATVNVLDFPGASTPAAYEWPTLGGNNYRTAVYGQPTPYQTDATVPPLAAYSLELSQNVPNPFGARTTIRYMVPRDQRVALRVYNVSGRLVRTLVDGVAPAGPNRVDWDGCDGRGKALSSGIYFYSLDDGSRTITRKGILLH
jgi:hypothetical protein